MPTAAPPSPAILAMVPLTLPAAVNVVVSAHARVSVFAPIAAKDPAADGGDTLRARRGRGA